MFSFLSSSAVYANGFEAVKNSTLDISGEILCGSPEFMKNHVRIFDGLGLVFGLGLSGIGRGLVFGLGLDGSGFVRGFGLDDLVRGPALDGHDLGLDSAMVKASPH